MPFLPEDAPHLQRALDLAAAAAPFASPNPTVGCVLTRNGKHIAEGAHHFDARDHAEIAALKNAGHTTVAGATAYVTLEPCSHHGRTGPCSEALIAAGIHRCVIATIDPNPQVSGQGLAKLQAAGIETVVLPHEHPLARRARRLNDAFAFSIQHGRPFVTLKSAISVDGKLAPPPAQRTATAPHWLTGEAARNDVQQLRHASDAILTGIGTVLADNPSLTDRTRLPRRRPLLRVLLDPQLRLPLTSQLATSAQNDLLVIAHTSAPADRETALCSRGIEILRLPGENARPNLTEALHHLQHRGLRSVLLEAGSHLNASFLRENLVDKIIFYIAETELGAHAIPFAHGGPSAILLQQQISEPTRTTFPHGASEDIRLSGYLHDPWSPHQPNRRT